MYRDKNLLALAKDQPCLLNLTSLCLWDEGKTTVAAHSNLMEHGKGRGLKAEDCYTVWACFPCHHQLDQGKMEYEDKERAFWNAFQRQVDQWIEIAQNPLLKPWKQQAARKVLKYLKDQNGTSS